MKHQINFLLFLLLLFTGWLFFTAWNTYHGKKAELALQQKQLEYKKEENKQRFMVATSGEVLIILDQVTGETWRFFRNYGENDRIEQEGWVELQYFALDEDTKNKADKQYSLEELTRLYFPETKRQ